MNNAFQDFNKAIAELKSTASQLAVSSCCRSGLEVVSGNEGTNYYVCVSCDNPCDAVPLNDIDIAKEPIKIAKNVMPIVYISGRYRSWIKIGKFKIKNPIGIAWNIWKARQASIKLWNQGYTVICPHMNTAHFDGLVKDDTFMQGDLEIIRRLRIKRDCIYMMKGWRQSEGAMKELALAKKRRLRIIYE